MGLFIELLIEAMYYMSITMVAPQSARAMTSETVKEGGGGLGDG